MSRVKTGRYLVDFDEYPPKPDDSPEAVVPAATLWRIPRWWRDDGLPRPSEPRVITLPLPDSVVPRRTNVWLRRRLFWTVAAVAILLITAIVFAAGHAIPAQRPQVASPPAISNPAISNPAISNPAISNPAISNPAISDPVIAKPEATVTAPSAGHPEPAGTVPGPSQPTSPPKPAPPTAPAGPPAPLVKPDALPAPALKIHLRDPEAPAPARQPAPRPASPPPPTRTLTDEQDREERLGDFSGARDLNSYCKSLGFKEAYSGGSRWICRGTVDGSSDIFPKIPIRLNAACEWAYGPGATYRQTRSGDLNSVVCVRHSGTRR